MIQQNKVPILVTALYYMHEQCFTLGMKPMLSSTQWIFLFEALCLGGDLNPECTLIGHINWPLVQSSFSAENRVRLDALADRSWQDELLHIFSFLFTFGMIESGIWHRLRRAWGHEASIFRRASFTLMIFSRNVWSWHTHTHTHGGQKAATNENCSILPTWAFEGSHTAGTVVIFKFKGWQFKSVVNVIIF